MLRQENIFTNVKNYDEEFKKVTSHPLFINFESTLLNPQSKSITSWSISFIFFIIFTLLSNFKILSSPALILGSFVTSVTLGFGLANEVLNVVKQTIYFCIIFLDYYALIHYIFYSTLIRKLTLWIIVLLCGMFILLPTISAMYWNMPQNLIPPFTAPPILYTFITVIILQFYTLSKEILKVRIFNKPRTFKMYLDEISHIFFVNMFKIFIYYLIIVISISFFYSFIESSSPIFNYLQIQLESYLKNQHINNIQDVFNNKEVMDVVISTISSNFISIVLLLLTCITYLVTGIRNAFKMRDDLRREKFNFFDFSQLDNTSLNKTVYSKSSE